MGISKLEKLNLPESEDGWQTEVPTSSDSLWWFYGWASDFAFKREDSRPRLTVVEIWNTPHLLSYVSDGAFVYPTEMHGKWKPASPGCLPKIERPTKVKTDG